MTLHIVLIERDGDRETVVPLRDIVFEGGPPAIGNLVRCEIHGEEVVGAVVSVTHDAQDLPDTSTVTLEQVDKRLLTEESGIAFLGEPGHRTPTTSTLDLSAPLECQPDKGRVY